MNRIDADQKNDAARRYANRPRSRLLDDPVVFNVVGTIGLFLFVGVLALWALARFVRGVASRLVHRLPERAYGVRRRPLLLRETADL
jgi:hypothetical protein